MEISVVICTYNRCEDLRDALESLEKQTGTETIPWEVIVVDNNSTDETKDLVNEFLQNNTLTITYVLEINQGLSYARNRGIKEAQGNIIAYIDDDVIVDTRWIAEIYKQYQECNFDIMGGRVLPIWEARKPEWLVKELEPILAILDWGDEPFFIKDMTQQIYGCNFIVHKKAFDKVGEFTIELGSNKKQLYRGDETDLLERVVGAGGTVIYQPRALVHHKVPAWRLKKSYYVRWYFYWGVGLSMTKTYDGRFKIMGVPTWMFRRVLRTARNNIFKHFTLGPTDRLRNWFYFFHYLGEIVGLAKLHWQNRYFHPNQTII